MKMCEIRGAQEGCTAWKPVECRRGLRTNRNDDRRTHDEGYVREEVRKEEKREGRRGVARSGENSRAGERIAEQGIYQRRDEYSREELRRRRRRRTGGGGGGGGWKAEQKGDRLNETTFVFYFCSVGSRHDVVQSSPLFWSHRQRRLPPRLYT